MIAIGLGEIMIKHVMKMDLYTLKNGSLDYFLEILGRRCAGRVGLHRFDRTVLDFTSRYKYEHITSCINHLYMYPVFIILLGNATFAICCFAKQDYKTKYECTRKYLLLLNLIIILELHVLFFYLK